MFALPEGENVVAGSAGFDRSQAGTLTVTTPSDKLIVNYDAFNIAAPESVVFQQPSANSVALNRVVGGDPSAIMGSLKANGKIFLVNPNGILFGANARVDVAALVASTLDIADTDFLKGNYRFAARAGSGTIVNAGELTAAPGGYICLLSKSIDNQAKIEARTGTVALAAGEAMTLALDDHSAISVVVDEAVKDSMVDSQGNKVDSAIKNSGTITADGGKVLLTAKVFKNVFDHAIRNDGVIRAAALVNNNGEIELRAEGAPITNTGVMEATMITIAARDAAINNSGTIKAEETLRIDADDSPITNSGTMSAGTITIETDGSTVSNTGTMQAQVIEIAADAAPVTNTGAITAAEITIKAASLTNAPEATIISWQSPARPQTITLELGDLVQQGVITANAEEGATAGTITITTRNDATFDTGSSTEARATGMVGNGGRIRVTSRGNTAVNKNAKIDISAGAIAGNGGRLDLDVYGQLGFFGILNGRAPPGYNPSLAYIDPATATVSGTYAANTIIDATGDITITGPVNFAGYTLTLLADHNNNTIGNWHDGSGSITASGFLPSLSGTTLNLYAGSGIGTSSSPLNISVGTLSAFTRSGGIYLKQSDSAALAIAAVLSNGSDISIKSPKSLTVSAGAVISSRKLNWGDDQSTAASTGNSGAISLESVDLTCETGSKLLAFADSGFTSGNVTLNAHDTTGVVLPIVQIKNTDAKITLNGCVIKGAAVTILATADGSRMYADDGAMADSPAIDALESISLLAGVAISRCNAIINFNSGTQINSATLNVKSLAKSEAVVRTISTAVGVSYAESDATAQTLVNSGAVITTTGKCELNASTDVKLDSTAWTVNLGGGRGAVIDLCLAIGVSDVESSAKVASGATLTVGGDLDVKADMTRSISVSSLGGAYEDGSVGVGVSITDATSNVNAFLDGTATVAGKVLVNADSQTPKHDTTASSAAGSGIAAKYVIKAANAAIDGVQGLFGRKKPAGDSRSGSQPLSLSAAFMYCDDTTSATARIGDSAAVKAAGTITVNANVSLMPEVSAIASVDSTDENKKKNAVAGAIVVAYFHDNASAYIGKNAVVDSRAAINVTSLTKNPYEIQWATISGVSDITDKLNPNIGIQNGFFTSWAQSNCAVEDIGVAGSVVLFSIANTSLAWIDENARVNQDAAYRSGAQAVTVSAKNEIETINLSGVFGLKGVGTNTGKTGIGGSYLEVDYTGTVKAQVKDGARVYADGLTVKAENKDRNISIAESGGKAGKYSINATFSVLNVTNTTYAQVDNGAVITGSGAVAIEAVDESQIYNIAGGITKGGNVGIGASVSINDINRDTRAVLGNLAATADAAGSFAIPGALTLTATNKGGIDSYSLAAAVTTDPQNTGDASQAKDASNGGGKYGITISGDVSINDITDITMAAIRDANVTGASTITLTATDDSDLDAYAGSVALSGNSSTSVGLAGSFTWNKLAYTTTACVDNSFVDASSDISLSAKSSGDINTVAASASIAWKDKGISVAGSVTLNELANTTSSYIARGSDVEGANIGLSSVDDAKLMAIAGTLSYGGKAGVGTSVALNYDDSDVFSYISASDVSASGNITAIADIKPDFLAVSASLAASKGNMALNCAVAYNDLDNQAKAYITGYKTTDGVSADGNIAVTAVDDMKILTIAGQVAVATGDSGAGIGGSFSVLYNDSTVEAYVGNGALVKAKGNTTAIPAYTGVKVSGARQTENITGLSLVALTFEDIQTIAAGGSGGGSAGIAASAPITKLTQITKAYIDANARVNEVNTGAHSDQSVNIRAVDDTAMLGIGGALAFGKKAGIGAGADIAIITKTTEAYIGQSALVNANCNILIRAINKEDFDSIAGSLAGGKSAGIAGAASVYQVTNITRAHIDPYATVTAEGNILIAASDDIEMDLIDATAQFGQAGIGGGAGVSIIEKTTEAYIANNAHVNAKGRADKPGIVVPVGAFVISYAANTTSDGEIAAPAVSNVNISNPALTSQRVATPQTRTIRGLGISAMSQDDIEIIAAGLAGSSNLSIEGSAVVNLLTNRTNAYIGEGALINDLAGAGAEQSVIIAASNDYYHMAIAGTGSISGTCGIGPAATISIVNNDAKAFIGKTANVSALKDIVLAANQSEDVLSIAAVLAGGGEAAIAGAVAYNSLNNHTYAYIADATSTANRATVLAGGNLQLSALDMSNYDIIAGSAAIGFGTAGAGGSVSVDNITKDTKAWIGNFTKADAKAAGADSITVFTGLLDGSGVRTTKLLKGISLQAKSGEDILHIVATGAGGLYGGLAGAVAVTTIKSNTSAYIGNNAQVNTVTTGVDAAQSVNLTALNDIKALSVCGGLSVGLVGVTGAVDVATVNNDTSAYIGNDSVVSAAHDIDINALSTKDISSYTVSASGAGVGVAGAVAIYNLGTALTSQSLGTMNANSGSGTAYGYVDQQVRQGIINSLLSGYSDTDVQHAATDVNNGTTSYSLTNTLTGTVVPGGVAAFIGDRAVVVAGGNLSLNARENVKFYVMAGGVSVAAAGAGGAVAILDFKTDALAYIGSSAAITTIGDVSVVSDLKEDIDSDSFSGSIGFVGNIGATVVIVKDKSNSAAYIGSSTAVTADDVTLTANSSHDQNTLAVGAAGSLMGPALAAGVINGYNSSTTWAYINNLAVLNATGNIGVNAVSVSNMKGVTYAPSLGAIFAAGAAVVILEDTSTTYASVNQGAKIEKAGAVTLSAAYTPMVRAEAWGGGAGAVAGGAAYSRAKVTGSVKAYFGDSVEVGQAVGKTVSSISLTSLLAIPQSSGSDVETAYAKAMAASLGILSGSGSDAAVEVNPTVEASIGNNAKIDVTGAITVSAKSRASGTADAEGISVALGAVGVSLARADMNPTVTARIGTGSEIGAGAAINLSATHNYDDAGNALDKKAYAYTCAAAGGGLVGTGADSDANAKAAVSAIIGAGSTVTSPVSAITVTAKSNNRAHADAEGYSVGLAGVGAALSDADSRGTVTASVNATTISSDLTVKADGYGYAKAETITGAGGILAGSGSVPTAYSGDTVTAALAGTHTQTGTVTVYGRDIPHAEAYADGINAGGLTVGVSKAFAQSSPVVYAYVAGGTSAAHTAITCKKLDVTAIQDVPSGSYTAQASGRSSSGSLIGVNATSGMAKDYGYVSAYIGDYTVLTLSGTLLDTVEVNVGATNNSSQYAAATGNWGALIGVGDNQATAYSDTETYAFVGKNVKIAPDSTGGKLPTLNVTAAGTDTNYANAVSGSGGVIAGAAATAKTYTENDTKAYIDSGSSSATTDGFRLLALNLTASHNSVPNAKSESVMASLVGASGAYADNDIISRVEANIGSYADITTYNISVNSTSNVTKDWLSGGAYNLNSGSGGVIDLPAAKSTTDISSEAKIITGTGVKINVIGSYLTPGVFNFNALSNVKAYDKAKLDSGGAISVAKAESLINNSKNDASVTIGDSADFDSVADIILAARGIADIRAQANAKTYGAAGAAEGNTLAKTVASNSISIGNNVNFWTELYLRFYAGENSAGTGNNYYCTAHTDLWNKTVLPIETNPQADAYISQSDTISIGTGCMLQSVYDTYVKCDEGTVYANGYGVGKDLYREALAAIGSFFSNLFGGGDLSLDVHGGSTTTISSRSADIDGTIKVGTKSKQIFVVKADGTVDTSLSSPEITYSTGTMSLSGDLQSRIDGLTNMINSLQTNLNNNSTMTDGGSSAQATALQTAINNCNARLSALNTEINGTPNGINAQISTKNAEITTLQGNITTCNNTIAADQGQITTLQTERATLNPSVPAQAARIAQIDALITNLNADITTQQGNVTTYNGQITTKNSEITTLTDRRTADNAEIATKTTQRDNYQSQLNALGNVGDNLNTTQMNDLIAAYTAEKAYLQSQLTNLGGSGTTVNKITLTNAEILARSSSIYIYADRLTGTGTLDAPGDAEINISNASNAFIRTCKLTIPDNAGGKVYFNYVPVYNNSQITARNLGLSAAAFSAINTSDNFTPLIKVLNSYTGTLTPGDIYIDNNISNLGGTVDIDCTRGSINVLNGVNIFGKTIKLSAGKDIFLGYVSGIRNVGGDIKHEWEAIYSPHDATGATSDYNTGSASVSALLGIYTAARDGGYIAGNNIFVSAERVNLNGTIQSGFELRSLTLGAALDTEIAAYKASYAAGGATSYEMSTNADVVLDKAKILAYYNAVTDCIEIEPASVMGGYMEIFGQILNTSLGELRMIDGYGTVTVTNNTATPIKIQGLSTGDNIEGMIKITDTGKRWPAIDGYASPVVTVMKRLGNTITYYTNLNGGALVPSGVTVSGRSTSYSPAANQYYTWTTQLVQVFRQTKQDIKETYFGLFGDSSERWTDYGSLVQQSFSTITDNAIWTAAAHSEAYWFDYTFYTYANDWSYIAGSYDKDEYVVYRHEKWDYERNVWYVTIRNHNISASNPVTVTFTGNDTGTLSVISKAGIIIDGSISNTLGNTTVESTTGAITQTNTAAVITAENLTLKAATGIGTAASPVKAALASTGKLTAQVTGTAGDIAITGTLGDLTINQVITPNGTATLQAESSIKPYDNTALVQANKIVLTSDHGTVGTSTGALRINTGSSAGNNLTVTAAGNIFLAETAGDLYLVKAESLGGNVAITVSGGNLIDDNPAYTIDERTAAQLDNLWDQMNLIGTDAEDSALQTVAAYERQKEREYRLYWSYRFKQADNGAAYDPAFQVTLTAEEKTQLSGMGWSNSQITDLEVQRTTEYHSLNTTYGAVTATFDPSWSYTATTAEQNELTDGYSWTRSQLENGISMGLLKEISSTELKIEDPNIAAAGNITVNASGNVGSNLAPITIARDALYASLTTDQKRALMAAERSDLDTSSPTVITIIEREDIDGQADGYFDVTSGGFTYLGSEKDINVKNVQSAGNLRFKGRQGIYADASNLAGPQIIAGDTILEAAGTDIGTSANPLVLGLYANAKLTSRCGEDTYIKESLRDLNIDAVYAPGHVYLYTSGSIYDAFNDALTNIRSNTMELRAPNGSIGTYANWLDIGVNTAGWVKAYANTAAGAGNIYLYSPTYKMTVSDLSAGGDIILSSVKELILTGAITFPVNLTLDSTGPITQRSGYYHVSNLIFDAQGNVSLEMAANDAYKMQGKTSVNPGWMKIVDSNDLILDDVSISLLGASTARGDITFTVGGNLIIDAYVSAHSDVTMTSAGQLDVNARIDSDHNTLLTAANDININAPVASVEDVVMTTSAGKITQSSGAPITARGISFEAAGPVTLTDSANDAQTLAGKTTAAGDIRYTDFTDVTIGTVLKSGITGISTMLGNFFLTTAAAAEVTPANLYITAPVSATAVNLNTADGIYQSGAGRVTCDDLIIRAAGGSDDDTVTMNGANDTENISAFANGSGKLTLSYTDSDGLAIANLDGLTGINTNNGRVTLTAGAAITGGNNGLNDNIRSNIASLNAATGITLDTRVADLSCDNSTSGDITIINTGDMYARSVVNHNGDVNLTVKSNLTVGTVTGNIVNLTATTGSILDDWGVDPDDLNTITANRVNLNAALDIGSADTNGDIDMDTRRLTVVAGGDAYLGTVNCANIGPITIGGGLNMTTRGDCTITSVTAGKRIRFTSTSGDLWLDTPGLESTGSGIDLSVNTGSLYALGGGRHFVSNGYSTLNIPNGTIGITLDDVVNSLNVSVQGTLVVTVGGIRSAQYNSMHMVGTITDGGYPVLYPASYAKPLYPFGRCYYNYERIWPSKSNHTVYMNFLYSAYDLMRLRLQTETQEYIRFLDSAYHSVIMRFGLPVSTNLIGFRVSSFDMMSSGDKAGPVYLYHPLTEIADFSNWMPDLDFYRFIDGELQIDEEKKKKEEA